MQRQPFVSRTKELNLLEDTFKRANLGMPQIVLIPGISGQGKTTLYKQFAQKLRKEYRSQVIIAEGISWSSTKAFQVWYDAFAYVLRADNSRLSQTIAEEWFATLRYRTPRLLRKTVTAFTGGWSDVVVEGTKTYADLIEAIQKRQEFQVSSFDLSLSEEDDIDTEISESDNDEISRFLLGLNNENLTYCFFLDDLQFADASSINILRYLSEYFANNPKSKHKILFVLAYRSNEVRQLHDGILHPMGKVEQELILPKYSDFSTPLFGISNGLPDNPPGISVQEYIENRFKRNRFSDDLADRVQKWTNGEAQFVHELFNLWYADRTIHRRTHDKSFVFDGEINNRFLVNKSVVIEQRIRTLDIEKRSVLKHASVNAFKDEIFLQEVIRKTLQEQSEIHPDKLSEYILSLIKDEKLITPAIDTLYQTINDYLNVYRFEHALIREVVYDRFLDNSAKKILHFLVAQQLENVLSSNASYFYNEIAAHYIRGGKFRHGLRLYLRLLINTLDAQQIQESESIIEEILSINSVNSDDPDIRFGIVLAQAIYERINNEIDSSAKFEDLTLFVDNGLIEDQEFLAIYFEYYDSHCFQTGKPERKNRLKAIKYYCVAERAYEALKLLRDAVNGARRWGLVDETEETIKFVRIWLNENDLRRSYGVQLLLIEARFVAPNNRELALTKRQEAFRLANIIGNSEQRFKSLIDVNISYTNEGKFEEALDSATQAFNLSKEEKRQDWEYRALTRIIAVHRKNDDFIQWQTMAEKRINLADDIGILANKYVAWNGYGYGLSHFGHKKSALIAYEKANEINEALGRSGKLTPTNNKAAITAFLGRFDLAIPMFDELLNLGIKTNDLKRVTITLRHLGRIAYRQWRIDDSISLFHQTISLCKGENVGDIQPGTFIHESRIQSTLLDLAIAYTRNNDFENAFATIDEYDSRYASKPRRKTSVKPKRIKAFIRGLISPTENEITTMKDIIVHYHNGNRFHWENLTKTQLAEIYRVKGDLDNALHISLDATQYAIDQEFFWRVDSLVTLANIYISRGNNILGLECLEKARSEASKMQILGLEEKLVAQIAILNTDN